MVSAAISIAMPSKKFWSEASPSKTEIDRDNEADGLSDLLEHGCLGDEAKRDKSDRGDRSDNVECELHGVILSSGRLLRCINDTHFTLQ